MIQWIKDYIAGPTHKWWVDNVWQPTWSKLWAGIYGIPSALVVAVEYGGKLAGDDKIAGLLKTMQVPDGVFIALAGVALVSYIASGRSSNDA